tara:strand:- start:686 stop:976 length:291 start_codon:yes stop_codon:yes gene_type:complete
MPAIGRVGLDNAGGGVIIGPGAPSVFADGAIVSCATGPTPGDTIFVHGEAPHVGATIMTGSGTVFAMGRPVTIHQFSTVSCGHTVSGSPATVLVGI